MVREIFVLVCLRLGAQGIRVSLHTLRYTNIHTHTHTHTYTHP